MTTKPRPDFDRDVLVPLRAAQKKAAEEKARLEALAAAEASRQAEEAAAAARAAQAVSAAPTTPVAANSASVMAAAGIAAGDYGFVQYIVDNEGAWDPCKINGGAHDCSYAINGGERAYGICQALPGNKMVTAGLDWATNAVTQMQWCNNYAISRYGSWAAAYAFWIRTDPRPYPGHWW